LAKRKLNKDQETERVFEMNTSDENKIRILIAEDIKTDVERMKSQLRKDGFKFISKQVNVKTKSDFLKALGDFPPDIILMGCNSPQFDEFSLVKAAQEQMPSIPVIVVAGSLDEKTAASLKAGAVDYLLKKDLDRLSSIIKGAAKAKPKKEVPSDVEKLDSIGALAGGIAHDYNNLLSVIMGNISLARAYLKPDDKAFMLLSKAEMAAKRASDLTQQFVNFARGGIPVKKPTDIASLLKETIQVVLSGSRIKCEISLSDDLWQAKVDERQIRQVIHNVIINAREAMPNGGILRVWGDNIIAGAEKSTPAQPLPDGRYVRIAVQDHGVGILEDNLSKIFDPYFSTKEEMSQKGIGLGLTSSFSIIRNHDGYIYAESKVGFGTTFYIYLPYAGTEVPKESPPEKSTVEKGDVAKVVAGKGKILVMDDERMIRDLVGEMLDRIGFKASLAEEGTESVRLYKQALDSGEPFDAVILDLTVRGGLGAMETIEKLQEIDPKVKAIVTSGFTDDPAVSNFDKYGFRASVRKPYSLEILSEVLQKVLVSP
jgi:signal transduction histidine kinase